MIGLPQAADQPVKGDWGRSRDPNPYLTICVA